MTLLISLKLDQQTWILLCFYCTPESHIHSKPLTEAAINPTEIFKFPHFRPLFTWRNLDNVTHKARDRRDFTAFSFVKMNSGVSGGCLGTVTFVQTLFYFLWLPFILIISVKSVNEARWWVGVLQREGDPVLPV